MVAVLSMLLALPLAAGAAPQVLSCLSSGVPEDPNATFTVDLKLIGNDVGPLSAYSVRVNYDEGQVDLVSADTVFADGFVFSVGPVETGNLGSGASSYRNVAAEYSGADNPLNGTFLRLTFEKTSFSGMPDFEIVGNPDVSEPLIDDENSEIPAVFMFSKICQVADVLYSVEGDPTLPNSPFTLYVRLANNSSDVGAFGFSLFFDPSEIQQADDAEAVPGSPFTWSQLLTTDFAPGQLNIAGTAANKSATNAMEGYMFQIDLTTTASPPASFDANGVPAGLILGDNPAIPDPLITPQNDLIPHQFGTESFGPPVAPAEIRYSVVGNALTPGGSFRLQARLANNTLNQDVGAIAFSIFFDASEVMPVGPAVNVAGSPIQFEILDTNNQPNRMNIAGTISDALNTSDEGYLFEIDFLNQGVALASTDGTGIPDNLGLNDNPGVSPPRMIEFGTISTAINHIFVREVYVPPTPTPTPSPSPTPPNVAQVRYSVDADALSPGAAFNVRARLANNVLNQDVGAIAFSINYDPAEVQPAGNVANVAGSTIQFEVLTSTVVGGNRVNIAGTISDIANTDTEDFLFTIPFLNQGVALASTDGTGIPDNLAMGDNPDVAPPTMIEFDTINTSIDHIFVREVYVPPTPTPTPSPSPTPPNVAQVRYSVDGDALSSGGTFNVRARLANNVLNQDVGAIAFSIFYDPAEVQPTGSVANVAGSTIQFEVLTSTVVGGNRVNIAGTISDIANTDTEDFLFTIPFLNQGVALASTDGTGIPDNLAMGDNPDVAPPTMIEFDTINTSIDHIFVREVYVPPTPTPTPSPSPTPPNVAQVRYSVDGDALSSGGTFNLQARVANNVLNQDVGAIAFSIFYDPAEVQPTGSVENYPGSTIQFEILQSTIVGGNRMNIAGTISDIANTNTEDFLFRIPFANQGVALASTDGTGIPDNLTLNDNPDVAPPTMIEFDTINTSIDHVFLREVFVPTPTPTPTATPTISPTAIPTTPTPTISPTPSPTAVPTTPTPTISPTPSPTVVPTTPTPTISPTPSPTAVPTTATPTASPTVSPTPTDTATATPTVSPTASPTPEITPIVFDFPDDPEGWTFTNPSMFSQVTNNHDDTIGALQTITSDNTNSFAFWESPRLEFGLKGLQANGPESLYRTTWTVLSDQADQSMAPVVRLRSSAFDFQRSDLLVATSQGNGDFSPGPTPRVYTQYFSQPENVETFRLDFDVLNVNPLDNANAVVSLDRVVIEPIGAPTTTATVVKTFDFTDGLAQGWTPRAAPPITAPKVFDPSATAGGLLIRGEELKESREVYEYLEPVIFGYWGINDNSITFNGSSLYRLRWTVKSDGDEISKINVPTFRLRVNSYSLKFSSLTNIDSHTDSALVPTAGSPMTFDQWFVAPNEIDGEGWILSFDYLFVDKDGGVNPWVNDDPEMALILESLEILDYGD